MDMMGKMLPDQKGPILYKRKRFHKV